ncbi:MAG: hypothetical protein U0930_04095 [Pirellulales bacterium]
MFRILSAGLIMIGLIVACESAQAQFGRLGPGGFRPPLPPLPPIPAPLFAGPGYVRVPGVPPVVPAVVARANYGYARNPAVVAVPLVVPVVASPYSAARVAVVQPVPSAQYRAGSVGYPTPSTATPRPVPAPIPTTAAPQPNNSNSNGDLRPGMVLPDGAIVLSVGQPNASAGSVVGVPAAAQPSFASPQTIAGQTAAAPTAAPQLGPTGSDISGTRSILEPAEELPVPQASPATNGNAGVRKF